MDMYLYIVEGHIPAGIDYLPVELSYIIILCHYILQCIFVDKSLHRIPAFFENLQMRYLIVMIHIICARYSGGVQISSGVDREFPYSDAVLFHGHLQVFQTVSPLVIYVSEHTIEFAIEIISYPFCYVSRSVRIDDYIYGVRYDVITPAVREDILA